MLQTFKPGNAAIRGIKFASMATLGGSIITSCVDSSGNVGGGYQSATAETADVETQARALKIPLPQPPKSEPVFERGYTAGCPSMMVRIDNYCIDRFEAYVVELKGGKELPHLYSAHPKDKSLKAKVAYNTYPQGYVSQLQASDACQNAGKRLCTMLEWKKACTGISNFKYPYGNQEEPERCNTRKVHLPTKLCGPDPLKWGDCMNDPLLNMIKGNLETGGSRDGCVSSYGAYDMVGNLHEWVSDLVTANMVGGRGSKPQDAGPREAKVKRQVQPLLKVEVGNGIFMGGFFSNSNENGEGCNYTTMAHFVHHYDYSTGFRCCRDADGHEQ